MNETDLLSRCIQSFDRWQHPWAFKQHCQTCLHAEPELLHQFNAMYENALDPLLWPDPQVCDAYKGTDHVVATLEIAFPGYQTEVYTAIARAASYEWR